MRRALPALLLAACHFTHGSGGGGMLAVDAAGGTPGDAPAVVDAQPGPEVALWHGRADDALAQLLLHYWTPGSAYLAAQSPTNGQLTGYWTYAQAFDAVLDGVERTDGARFAGWIEALYLAQNAKGWSRPYYDDENWMTLALIRAYDLVGDPKYLTQAKALYANIEAAWDTTCCGAHPGGVWWDTAHTQKATASNAGPVIAGVRLAARTGDASYLTFAKQVYAFWLANMVDPASGAVTDHINHDGSLAHYKFTYNEGLVIGAAVALYGATQDASYLADAHRVAGHMLAAETVASSDGNVLFDGTNAGCGGDCQQFKGIGYRYLSALLAADPHAAAAPQYAALLDASGRATWELARGNNGLFATDWAGPAMTSASIDADSSAAMTLSLYARALGADPRPRGMHYEAEDGVVHAIGLEAMHGSFSGWGYLAGWNADGQWVDFHVEVATADTYHLTLRYAAGAGDASRLIYANGANVVANQKLASTGSWDTWSTVTLAATLPAGASTISVIYNAGQGSTNYVNLDYLDVAP